MTIINDKTQSGIKLPCIDPYTEAADIVEDWCKANYYGAALVTLSIDGFKTTEFLSFNGDKMEFVWDNDWWEGQTNIVFLGFRMLNDVLFYGIPH